VPPAAGGPLAPDGPDRHTRGMDQDREDYRDGPDPPPSSWNTKRVLWLLLPLAFLVAIFAAALLSERPTP